MAEGHIGTWGTDHPNEVVAVLDRGAVVVIAAVNPLGELNAATADAHTRLIASAPSLLAALRLCVQRIERPELSPDANVVLEQARAAIQMATGGDQ